MDGTMIIFYTEVPKSSFVTNMQPKMGKQISILSPKEKKEEDLIDPSLRNWEAPHWEKVQKTCLLDMNYQKRYHRGRAFTVVFSVASLGISSALQ